MKNQKTEDIVKGIIAQLTGAEAEDIKPADSIREDLNINIADLSEIGEKLTSHGLEADKVNWGEIETVSDLIDLLEEDEL